GPAAPKRLLLAQLPPGPRNRPSSSPGPPSPSCRTVTSATTSQSASAPPTSDPTPSSTAVAGSAVSTRSPAVAASGTRNCCRHAPSCSRGTQPNRCKPAGSTSSTRTTSSATCP